MRSPPFVRRKATYFRRGYMPDGKGVYHKYKPYDSALGKVDPEDLTVLLIKKLR